MEKKGKRTGVSRRDFLKGLGGGAVGAAVISAGLLDPDRAEGASAAEKVPFRRNSDHFREIKQRLDLVLADIQGAIRHLPDQQRPQVLWVSCRLNRAGSQVPNPVFVGWVEEDDAAKKTRLGRGHANEPIDTRFGDTHVSTLYRACFAVPPGNIVGREWNRDQADPTSQELGKEYYGETHRRSIPIQLGNSYIGTLNAAFLKDPQPADQEISRVLKNWAQAANSSLVTYIQRNLIVGRLPHPL